MQYEKWIYENISINIDFSTLKYIEDPLIVTIL